MKNSYSLRYPHPVLLSSKLKRKKIVEIVINDNKFTLFRNKVNKPQAVPSACPHRGANLAKGKLNKNFELICPYHAWKINHKGIASSPSAPKRVCKIHNLKTWEKYGVIWVANEDTTEKFPDFMEDNFSLAGKFSQKFEAPINVVIDNFSEIEHAFKVHRFIGSDKKDLHTVNFSVSIEEEETKGISSGKYRKQPFIFRKLFGIEKGDYYHNDWSFKFKPLNASYRNYWTNKTGNKVRSNQYIITTFFTPITSNKVDIFVFVQMSIKNKLLRKIKSILSFFTVMVTKYEIWEDAKIARFAPEKPEENTSWKLTSFDKQIFHNRKKAERIYFGIQEKNTIAEEV